MNTMNMRMLVFLTSLCLFGSVPSQAEPSHKLTLWAGADTWLDPVSGMHAAFLAAYDLGNLPLGAHLGASFNTDTARLSFDRLALPGGWFETGIRLAYEYNFANLLVDHWVEGRELEERSFVASYLRGEIYLKALLPQEHYLEINLGLRRWMFGAAGKTSEFFTLPADSWVLEPRLNWTLWRLQSDPSLADAHRPFPRVRGLALGISLGLDLRESATEWGALDPLQFQHPERRNQPAAVIFLARQWLRAGWEISPRLRTQIFQAASFGHGEDDLTRPLLGGQNPWVVPLAGVPWAAFHSEKFLFVESSWHFSIWRELEAGALAQGLLLEDPKRAGEVDVYGLQVGLGLFLDLRFGDFQVDLRGGWSPTHDFVAPGGSFGLFASGGWQWY